MKILIKIFIVIVLVVPGCSDLDKPEIGTAADIEVSMIDDKEIEQIINDRSGNILLVNVWATWCLPCVEEFPDLVKIYNEYREKEFDYLSLSVDYDTKSDSLVRSFMSSQQADFPVYIVREESSENVINLLSEQWSGAIPATFIYDRNGVQQKFILGAHSYDEFKESIDNILNL